ncbi:hypothetical protein NDU88_005030 [Pleurodeles waltl]|uniref:ribonuclease H n=1 Tax=Pleurodeles waltl TaxID=8319 RepID=A0AAV7M8T3_PLEWA|nr:hypothetical protein NDU88_005030 [Pleurodeles waltl]
MATLDNLLQAVTQMQKDLTDSKNVTANLVSKVTQLQSKVDGSDSTIHPMVVTPTNIAVNVPPQIPLAAPERFSGDPNKVQIILTQVELHFTCRPSAFPDAQSRIAFLILYLSGDAAIWAVPLVRVDSALLYNWCLFVEEFEKVFDRQAITMSADKQLLELRQGNKDLITYLSHFNRLVVETAWPEEKRNKEEEFQHSIATAAEKEVDLPSQFLEYSDVFSEKKACFLPPHRPYDCQIDLVPGANIRNCRIYTLSVKENQVLREYLDQCLANKLIRPSRSPAASPLFFVSKANGDLRPCIDFRATNKITVKNKYPLPLIPVLLDQVKSAVIYTKLDLRGAYHLVRIREGDEWKTAFKTHYGLFEYLVMPFGLCNDPAAFQYFLNDVLREYLDIFVIVYIDDILI